MIVALHECGVCRRDDNPLRKETVMAFLCNIPSSLIIEQRLHHLQRKPPTGSELRAGCTERMESYAEWTRAEGNTHRLFMTYMLQAF